jgi:hypothetical protein
MQRKKTSKTDTNQANISTIDTLIPDEKNFNKGTEYGQKLLEDSLRRFGAGRSILVDKNNRIIAGNKTVENAGQLGMNDVIIVETDGTKLVAVKRTDIDIDTKKGREMALADNSISKVDLSWDEELLRAVAEDMDFDPHDWGVDLDVSIPEDNEEAKAKHDEDWFINIECTGESQCQQLYDELIKRGIICKIIH